MPQYRPMPVSTPTNNSLPESRVWSESERIHALSVFAETRSALEASRQTGIPHNTISNWVATDEGQATIENLRTILRQKVAWIHARNTIRAAEVVYDRLQNGDPVVLHDGTTVKRGVSAKDAMMISAVSQDKHASLVGQFDAGINVDKTLNALADKLVKKLGERNTQARQPIDIDDESSSLASSHMG